MVISIGCNGARGEALVGEIAVTEGASSSDVTTASSNNISLRCTRSTVVGGPWEARGASSLPKKALRAATDAPRFAGRTRLRRSRVLRTGVRILERRVCWRIPGRRRGEAQASRA
jgi:hypothetical protein